MSRNYLTDVVIVGSSVAGLACALRARRAGLEVIVLGGSGNDDGLVWVPEDYPSGRNYLDHVAGSATLMQTERRHAFAQTAPGLISWLDEVGVKTALTNQSDYYPRLADGAKKGRVWRVAKSMLSQKQSGLTSRLAVVCQSQEVTTWLDARLAGLVFTNARAAAVKVWRAGRQVVIGANSAIILAEGGFANDAKLRRRYLPGTRVEWSLANQDAIVINAVEDAGLDVDAMSSVWGLPGMFDVITGKMVDATKALVAPGGILVDELGKRFCNESAPPEVIHQELRSRCGWLIFDSRHRKTVSLGMLRPGRIPKRLQDEQTIISSRSLEDLARLTHLPVSSLVETATRVKQLCDLGADLDFSRPVSQGGAVRLLGSANGLAPLVQPPFYATRIFPADNGTKGGVSVDADQHALSRGEIVPGLFAIGSACASLSAMGTPAPGMANSEALVSAARVPFVQNLTPAIEA